MKRVALLLSVVLLLVEPPLARASGPDLGGGLPDAKPDTTRFLPRWLNASLGFGMDWMQSPELVRSRYGPGVSFSAGLWTPLAPRMRFAIEAEYLDLPSKYYSVRSIYDPYSNVGAGHTVDGLAVVSFRPWRNLWLEAGAGGGYFTSGYSDFYYVDGLTGETVLFPDDSGWGAAITAGLAYDFTIGKRLHLFAQSRWLRFEGKAETLHLVPIRVGYRFD